MIRSVDATDRGPGYDSSSEHLADWAALTALYIERLTAVRRATPQRVQVTAADRRAPCATTLTWRRTISSWRARAPTSPRAPPTRVGSASSCRWSWCASGSGCRRSISSCWRSW
ncbi:MAG: hypothetical protein IPH80_05385 [Myxococcales bacterium]|nr:hypothetical protein [Myxococcales bacterium]